MTPKEKAKELIEEFSNAESEDGYLNQNHFRHKQCAIIAVNEIIKANPIIETRIIKNGCSWIESKTNINYWQEVKQEIEKL